MKILLDTCVSAFAKTEIHDAGHDVVWMGDQPEDPGDLAILAIAHREERVLITLDKDFGELAIVRQLPHCGIVRLANLSARQQGRIAIHILETHNTELLAGAIITAEPGRLRIRPPACPREGTS